MFAFLMGLKNVRPAELAQLIQQRSVTVFDVNSLSSWQKAHVPGALHLDPTGYVAADLPTDRATSLVFYCSNPMCRKAPIAARRAKAMGWANAQVMSAGITGWIATNLSTESGVSA